MNVNIGEMNYVSHILSSHMKPTGAGSISFSDIFIAGS